MFVNYFRILVHRVLVLTGFWKLYSHRSCENDFMYVIHSAMALFYWCNSRYASFGTISNW